MRIRTVKPEFWKHEPLASCSEFTRLLALALLNYADDEGYFMAHPRLIQGELFPFEEDSKKIPRAIQELSSIGYITLSETHDGRAAGHITNFLTHQRVDKPKPSSIKESIAIREESKTIPRLIQGGREREEEQGKGMEAEAEEEAAAAASDSLPKITPETLVDAYPRRSHYADALREAKACLHRHDPAAVIAGTRAIAAVVARWSESERLTYLKKPNEFFAGDHWRDDPNLWRGRKDRTTTPTQEELPSLGGRKPASHILI